MNAKDMIGTSHYGVYSVELSGNKIKFAFDCVDGGD